MGVLLLVDPGVAVALPVEKLCGLEEERAFSLAAFDAVAGVDQVLAAFEAEVAADAPRCCFGRVGGAYGAADRDDGAGTIEHHREHWRAGDVLDEATEEGLAFVF